MTTEKKNQDPNVVRILEKIATAKSVLVALSNNPSMDEMAAALGLTLMLDKVGKHATAIYSGATPNALEFLRPEETFEKNTHSLQEFIIALDKEKADHLRYKVDGNYVKIYITPYKTNITKEDLEFARGDYNVDLVIAMNVLAPKDLDGALAEHGRILHNASTINIAVSEAGRFGEIEWTAPKASSVSEMIFALVNGMKEEEGVPAEVATALLTGIVAATDRFSNDKTRPTTMTVAARLMAAGADQQLVSANIPVAVAMTEERTVGGANLDDEAEAGEMQVATETGQPGVLAAQEAVTPEVAGEVEAMVPQEVIPETAVQPVSQMAGRDEERPVESVQPIQVAEIQQDTVQPIQSTQPIQPAAPDASTENIEIINGGQPELSADGLPIERNENAKQFDKMMDAALTEAVAAEKAEAEAAKQAAEAEQQAKAAAVAAKKQAEEAEYDLEEIDELEAELAAELNGETASEAVAVDGVAPVDQAAPVGDEAILTGEVAVPAGDGVMSTGNGVMGSNGTMPNAEAAGNTDNVQMVENAQQQGVEAAENGRLINAEGVKLAPIGKGISNSQPMMPTSNNPAAMMAPMMPVMQPGMAGMGAQGDFNDNYQNASMQGMMNPAVMSEPSNMGGMTPVLPMPGVELPPPAPPIDFNAEAMPGMLPSQMSGMPPAMMQNAAPGMTMSGAQMPGQAPMAQGAVQMPMQNAATWQGIMPGQGVMMTPGMMQGQAYDQMQASAEMMQPMQPVQPIQPAVPDVEQQNFQSAGTGLAMNDQLYPPDPSAFRIPGM